MITKPHCNIFFVVNTTLIVFMVKDKKKKQTEKRKIGKLYKMQKCKGKHRDEKKKKKLMEQDAGRKQ